jgi:WD40 repeat protein
MTRHPGARTPGLAFLLLTAALLAGRPEARPAAPPLPDIDRLIRQLGSDAFDQREAAARRLGQLGRPALPALRRAAAGAPDLEVRARAAGLVERLARRFFGPVRALRGHADKVTCVAFSPDGKRALTTDSHNVRLWDVESGKELRLFRGHRSKTLSVLFTRDGRRAVSCSGWPPEKADFSVRVWDVRTGRELRRMEGHTDTVWRLALSPDGRSVLSASRDQTMRL